MKKRDSFKIRKSILLCIKNSPLTLAQLERKVNTNSETIKRGCKELEFYRLLKIQKFKHPSNGRLSFNICITELGLDIIQNTSNKSI